MITRKDIAFNNTWEISLSNLIGKEIKDITGYLSEEYGDITFVLNTVVFIDDTKLGIEGEHDFPFLVEYLKQPQPNFDDETLQRLYEESEED
jgi:hypothetical protein